MNIDFREVLHELEAREEQLMQELNDIKTAKPALERLARSAPAPQRPIVFQGAYAGLGTKDAIITLLVGQSKPMGVSAIAQALLDGGVKTKSADFVAVVKSTLGQLKTEEKVDRKEDGWVALPMDPSELDSSEYVPPSLQ